MSYDDYESSNYGGVPTTLYEFSLGTNVWRYSAAESDVYYAGEKFEAVPVDNSGEIQSGDTQNDDYTVTLPSRVPFAQLFISTPPSEPIYLIVREKHRDSEDALISGVFTISSVRRRDQITVEVVCKTLTASLNRNGLRLSFGRGCPHALYDRNCRVNPAAYGVSIQVQAMTGATVTSSSLALLPAGYLNGGYFEYLLMPGVMERRAIESHSGDKFVVLGTTDGLIINNWVTVYPGCDRVTATCQNKFNNLANYGGFPHLPTKSPFDGDPVF